MNNTHAICYTSLGDYGSMVNEVVGTGDWSNEESLGETWKGKQYYIFEEILSVL